MANTYDIQEETNKLWNVANSVIHRVECDLEICLEYKPACQVARRVSSSPGPRGNHWSEGTPEGASFTGLLVTKLQTCFALSCLDTVVLPLLFLYGGVSNKKM